MLLSLLGIAALLAVAAFFIWNRHTDAVARIEGALRAQHATDIRIAQNWFDFDRDTLTYDVTFSDSIGQSQHRRCKVAIRFGADGELFWSPLL